MLERFRNNIQVNHSDNDISKKNKRRHKAIKERTEEKTFINKPTFIEYIEGSEHSKEEVQSMKENIRDIDFSNANPRNNKFMNELAFAGESMTEGFLDVFNIEVDKSVDRYKDQLQIIEERDLDKDESRFFIGGFRDKKLKRLTPKKETKKELEPYIERHEQRELKTKQNKSKNKERTLDNKIEEE